VCGTVAEKTLGRPCKAEPTIVTVPCKKSNESQGKEASPKQSVRGGTKLLNVTYGKAPERGSFSKKDNVWVWNH